MKIRDVMSCSFPAWYDKFKKCSIKSESVAVTGLEYDAQSDTERNDAGRVYYEENEPQIGMGSYMFEPEYEVDEQVLAEPEIQQEDLALLQNMDCLVVPLTPEVLTYLQDDGTLVLPEGSQPELTYERGPMPDEPTQDWDHCEASGCVVEGPKLEDFTNKIRDAITKLGGSVFPKLNWSAPKDASWIAFNNSLRCGTPGDVFLLLKSSSFVTHDLTAPFEDCNDSGEADSHVDYCLVLRHWMDINPAYEFRCFVKEKELVGISQRDVSQSYSCIGGDRTNIRSDIISFWRENIENRFPLQNYVFDVYRPAKDHVLLLDFNTFGERTEGLLFSWSELQQTEDEGRGLSRIIEDELNEMRIEDTEDSNMLHYNERNLTNSNRNTPRDALPEFRFIADATGVQPSPYMQYGLPVDIIDLTTGQDPQKLIDLLQMKIQNEADESSEDEEVPS
ncbi:Cell division cycle protein 123 [Chionoecetes opilio]|uniref:Cell division cycle protein 123 n=1 Tax=Chionoecetes opilio TaxID=41210 RepID=A0A8J5CJB2_CHIOP|nr:Cell division cycle protein 123 [Chionoecetes opilio]